MNDVEADDFNELELVRSDGDGTSVFTEVVVVVVVLVVGGLIVVPVVLVGGVVGLSSLLGSESHDNSDSYTSRIWLFCKFGML